MKLRQLASCLPITFLLTASCSGDTDYFSKRTHDVIDPEMGLSRDDYSNIHAPKASMVEPPIPGEVPNIRVEEEISLKPGNIVEPVIPDVAQIIAAPRPPKIGKEKLVSVAVTDDVPLKDVLVELARLADVDIEVDASIVGGVSFRAKDRPFNEVVERIANLAGLRYSMKNNVLRVERDTPYIQVYPLDFINVDRVSTGSISVNSTGGGGSSGGSSSSGNSSSSSSSSSSGSSSSGSSSSSGTTNTSSSSITATSTNDFWAQLEKAVDGILKYNPSRMLSNTSIQAQPVVPQPANPGSPGAPGAPGSLPPTFQSPDPAQSSIVNSSVEPSFYILNRQAGTLTISGTEKQHDIIKSYLSAMEKNVSSQVLIEAKIVEVTLNNRYQSGIEWGRFGNQNLSFRSSFNTVAQSASGSNPANINVLSEKMFGTGVDLNLAVNLLDEFGTSRTMSSPRLHAMNNQQAVLTFAENIVYFKLNLEVTPGQAGTGGSTSTQPTVEVTSSQNSVPVGLLLTLQPSINTTTDEITLNVRPTLTKVIKFVPDPAYPIIAAQAVGLLTGSVPAEILERISSGKNEVPQIETRELDSVLKIKSGQVMVIGGLLEDKVLNNDTGVPGASEVPYIGNLFKNVDKQNTKKELVIFIRATTVGSSGSATSADQRVYDKFFDDPRPLKF